MQWIQKIEHVDKHMFTGINNTPLRTKWLDTFMLVITQLGEGWVEFLAISLFNFTIATSHIWYWQSIVSIVIAGLVCQFFKRFFPRMRPLNVMSEVFVVGPKLFKGSFPSGHTATAFAIATLFTYYFPGIGQLFFLLAALVGISRVYVGAHFPFDVLSGSFVGICVSLAVIWLPYYYF